MNGGRGKGEKEREGERKGIYMYMCNTWSM